MLLLVADYVMSDAASKTIASVREARLSFQRCEMRQKTFEEYYSELQGLLKLCKYPSVVQEENLIQQIIHGVTDDSLRDLLISLGDIPLHDIVIECRKFYLSPQNSQKVKDVSNNFQSVSFVV